MDDAWWPLRDAWVTLGDPWVTQPNPKPNQAEGCNPKNTKRNGIPLRLLKNAARRTISPRYQLHREWH